MGFTVLHRKTPGATLGLRGCPAVRRLGASSGQILEMGVPLRTVVGRGISPPGKELAPEQGDRREPAPGQAPRVFLAAGTVRIISDSVQHFPSLGRNLQ